MFRLFFLAGTFESCCIFHALFTSTLAHLFSFFALLQFLRILRIGCFSSRSLAHVVLLRFLFTQSSIFLRLHPTGLQSRSCRVLTSLA